MEVERAAWQLLEQRDDERTELEQRLQASESQRLNLLKNIVAMRQNAEALDEDDRNLLQVNGLNNLTYYNVRLHTY